MDPESNSANSSFESRPQDNHEEPTAAHFREAARLAAARVRTSLSDQNRTIDTTVSDTSSIEAPDAAMIEEAALRQARPVAAEHADDAKSNGKGKKATAKALNAANEKAVSLLPEIDERLETGARMLRAFESQIERLERSAEKAEQSNEAPVVDQAGTISDEQLKGTIEDARGTIRTLENINNDSVATANALAGGLETASTIKNLLETTIRELAEEAERRSEAVRQLMLEMESSIGTMTSLIQRAGEIEASVVTRLQQTETTALEIERTVTERLDGAQASATRVQNAADEALGSVRIHVAQELAAISQALLKQADVTPTPRTTVGAETSNDVRASGPIDTTPNDPPLIEMTANVRQPQVQTPAERPLEHQGQISHGTLSIDEDAIKRRNDAH